MKCFLFLHRHMVESIRRREIAAALQETRGAHEVSGVSTNGGRFRTYSKRQKTP